MNSGRLLLTGASGLIGRHSIEPLRARGYEVVCVSHKGRGGLPVDLLEPQSLRRLVEESDATTLVHLAWADGRNRWSTPANLDWVSATLGLLRSFSAAGGKRAVLVGSCAEYDWGHPILSENSPLNPATLYGAAKARLGQLSMAAAPALDLSLAWARPFFVYGPGEPPGRLFGDLIRGLAAGQTVDCTDGEQRRDFLHVDDLGLALATLVAGSVEGAVNIGSGNAVPVKEMIQTLARRMGRSDLVRLGARPRLLDDPACIQADITRLRDEVGFLPRHDMETGIAAVLRAEGIV